MSGRFGETALQRRRVFDRRLWAKHIAVPTRGWRSTAYLTVDVAVEFVVAVSRATCEHSGAAFPCLTGLDRIKPLHAPGALRHYWKSNEAFPGSVNLQSREQGTNLPKMPI